MRRKYAPGFTLVELVVTIAIVAILAAIAFPSFQSTLRSTRGATMSNELLGSLALARTEAIRSTKPGAICASANGSTCGTDWNQGWMVWVDADDDGTLNGTETLVRFVEAHPLMNLVVTSTGGASTSLIKFDSRGRPDNRDNTRTLTLTPVGCTSTEVQRRTMTMTGAGQVNTVKGNCP